MRFMGHDAHEIVFDLETLQKTWAEENGIQYDHKEWQTEIIMKQIETLRPDIVYFQDVHSLPYSIRKNLKKDFSFIKLMAVYKGFPGAFNELNEVDALFVGTRRIAEQFRCEGLKPYLVYHAFDTAVLEKIDGSTELNLNPCYGFAFAGSSGHGYGGHRGRFWMLVELIKKTNIELWIDDREGYPKDGLDKLPNSIREALEKDAEGGNSLGEIPPQPLKEMFPARCHPSIFGLDMFRVFRDSKVTLNKHTDAALDNIGNIRLFQTTGVGTCLLTDTGINMPDLFEEDHEVVTYTSVDECIEKADYLLTHEDFRRNIAAAGQRRTLREHTVLRRCQQIDEILQALL
jgi:hypothetical protein